MKKIKYTFALFTVLFSIFFIFDGFLDHVLYFKYKVTESKRKEVLLQKMPENVDKKFYAESYEDGKALSYYTLPFLGSVLRPTNQGIYNINEYGHRIFPRGNDSEVQSKNILLLGSSQSFGYRNKASDALSVYLENMLPEYKVDNYSMPGADLDVNFMDWSRMAAIEKKHYDLVIVVNGLFNHYTECTADVDSTYLENTMHKYRLPALVSVVQSLKERFLHKDMVKSGRYCEQFQFQSLAVRSVQDHWNRLLAFGKEQGTKTLIFIPPSVWSDNVNVENLQPALNEKTKVLYSTINNRIYSQIDNSSIINLTHVFDDGRQYFLDTGSHYTTEGSALLARKIAKHIQDLDNKVLEGN